MQESPTTIFYSTLLRCYYRQRSVGHTRQHGPVRSVGSACRVCSFALRQPPSHRARYLDKHVTPRVLPRTQPTRSNPIGRLAGTGDENLARTALPSSLQTHSHSPSPLLSHPLNRGLALVLFLRSALSLAPRSHTPRASQRNFPGVGTRCRCHHHHHYHHRHRQRYQHHRFSTTTATHRAVTFVFSTFTNTDNEILYTSITFHHHQIRPPFHSDSPRLDTDVSLSFVYPTFPSLVLFQVSHNFSNHPTRGTDNVDAVATIYAISSARGSFLSLFPFAC